ncbi:RHS repeat-associated core domain-containing protein [Mariniradius sediminis]|uniref:RHS repeat-associated core domain-containing protein n=1 Tax=Mariniradius sediminis TaxID=2909237 RepID=A0ABS9BV35_9BACT|nr:RHS repeat-associated core domain-containing protein [Mariniradius sediminis]MCF1751929.1 RHS repeat-associated core domain-containing protein [Mariniradius sediminis]
MAGFQLQIGFIEGWNCKFHPVHHRTSILHSGGGGINQFLLFKALHLLITGLQQKPAPEAYLGYALYDADSNMYDQGRIVLSKKARNRHEELKTRIFVPKDGYIEAYVVNESEEDVWFDQFRILSTGAVIVQETHYDPWGVELQGLGYQQGGLKVNKYLYNGKEFNDHLGLNLFDYGQRMYDPSIGRFNRVDRFSEKYAALTPFQYGANNPIKYIDVNGDSTYLVVYGSGHLNPKMQGQSNDVGNGFKKNAEARAEGLRKNLQDGDEVVVVYAATEDEYINALNTEYSSGVIKQLDVYSHGTNNSINLGGPESGAPTETGPGDADYRLVSAFASQQNPDGNNEVARIDANNFSTNATVNLWGCNLGGANTAAITSGANHAQYMANHLGGSSTVNAFNGGGGAEFKQSGGAIKYDGTMIRSADRGSQRVIQTTYKPR